MSLSKIHPAEIEAGVVGIGLMGSSIIAGLLAAGHHVKAIAPITADFVAAGKRINEQLRNCYNGGFLKNDIPYYLDKLEISMDYGCLADCNMVIECVIEDVSIKEQVYKNICSRVAENTVIASNTSAIAITTLQQLVPHPERFLGIHFAEPAYATRFLEITCGDQTDLNYADWIFNLAHLWGKQPTLLRKDIKGFITNRLMYAVYREIFYLVENEKTTIEDADKAFRYGVGSWITLMGLFRRIDYTDLADYAEIFKRLFPQLSNAENVPEVMEKIVEDNGCGIQNLKGLYAYTNEEAVDWAAAFAAFNEDIFHLVTSYPTNILEKV